MGTLHSFYELIECDFSVAVFVVELEHHIDVLLVENCLLIHCRCYKLSIVNRATSICVYFFEQLLPIKAVAHVFKHFLHALLDFLQCQYAVLGGIDFNENVLYLLCLLRLQLHGPEVGEYVSLEDILLSERVHVRENLLNSLDVNILILQVLGEPWMVKQLVSREPTRGVFLQACQNELYSLWTQGFLGLAEFGWALHDCFIDLILCFAVERSVASQHYIDYAPHRPDIHLEVIFLAQNDLRSHVKRAAEYLVETLLWLELTSKSEVSDFNDHIVFVVALRK